jgi:hypothetical protein
LGRKMAWGTPWRKGNRAMFWCISVAWQGVLG